MSQFAGAHAGLAQRARARAQVAETTRILRPRVAAWRQQQDPAAAPPLETRTAAPDAVTDPGRRGCTPGRTSSDGWPPPPAGPREWAKRILAFLALALAATGFFFPTPGGAVGFVLAAFLAALICALLELLTKITDEPEGKVTSRGRR